MSENNRKNKSGIVELIKLFLKLGTIAFGGPAAHIAIMEEEVVRRRKWITREHFSTLSALTNLIPDRIQPRWRFISDI